jgi:hypothetical protein
LVIHVAHRRHSKRKRATSIARRAFCFFDTEMSAHQLFDFRRFAFRFVPGVIMPAVKALLPEAGATPNQVVHSALQLLDAIREVRCRRRA